LDDDDVQEWEEEDDDSSCFNFFVLLRVFALVLFFNLRLNEDDGCDDIRGIDMILTIRANVISESLPSS
jgi:hypothetical protein